MVNRPARLFVGVGIAAESERARNRAPVPFRRGSGQALDFRGMSTMDLRRSDRFLDASYRTLMAGPAFVLPAAPQALQFRARCPSLQTSPPHRPRSDSRNY